MAQFDPKDLDDLFAAARQHDAPPAPAFLEQALANAYAAQPMAAVALPKKPARSGLRSLFGNWQAVSALAASVLAGFWIGYADWQGLASAGPFATLVPSLDETLSSLDAFDMTLTAFEDQQT